MWILKSFNVFRVRLVPNVAKEKRHCIIWFAFLQLQLFELLKSQVKTDKTMETI